MTSHDPTAPAGEPDITVPAGTIGTAAEVLALISELIASEPDVTAAVARFLAGKDARPLPATAWLITSISGLAAKLDGVLAAEGIACDRGLARYQKAPAR
jgi:hypothetical protein